MSEPVTKRSYEPMSLQSLVGEQLKAVSLNRDGVPRAGYAWNAICGEVAKRHTCGLYLEQLVDRDPILHVYIDSQALVQDFATDHLLYERRLQEVGLNVSRVRFDVSRKAGQKREPEIQEEAAPSLAEAGPLTAYQQALIKEACGGLEGELKEALQAAMEASFKREQLERKA